MVKVDTLQGASCSRIFNDATLDSAAKELETPLASTPPSIWILRTELLTEQPTNYAEPSIADYDQRRGCSSSIGNHRTAGNPAIPRRSRERSSRLPARTRRHDVSSPVLMRVATTEQKLADLRSQIDANRDLSTSLAFE